MNRSKRKALLFLLAALLLFGCAKTPDAQPAPSSAVEAQPTNTPAPTDTPAPTASPMPELPAEGGGIFLYGEWHSDPACLARELELWDYFYAQGIRHLFIEYPYYYAEYCNLWMAADDDEILEQLFRDTGGTAGTSPETFAFFQTIKEKYPETVFHGVDVGYQYDTTGARYLHYLESIGQQDSEAYALAKENISQGRECSRFNLQTDGFRYREQRMAENFKREYDKLGNENIMGIFGAAHALTSAQACLYYSPETVTMTMMLEEYYGSRIQSSNLFYETHRESTLETMTVNGKEYVAERYTKLDLDDRYGYLYQEFWKLTDAYEDFKNCPQTGKTTRCIEFPVPIETNQVYVIDSINLNGELERQFFRADEPLPAINAYYPYSAKEYFDYLIMPEIKAESPGA